MVKRTESLGAGDLRSKVRLEKRGIVDDGFGNPVAGDWEAQFTRSAYIGPLKGGESVIAARLEGRQPAVIVLRYSALTRTITNEWRAVEIRQDGTEVIYAIADARDMENRRRHITLLCEAGIPA